MMKAEILERQIELFKQCISLFEQEIVKAHSDYLDFESKCKSNIKIQSDKINALTDELERIPK